MTPDPGVSAGAAEDQGSSIDSGGPGSDAIIYFTLNLNAKASRTTDKKMQSANPYKRSSYITFLQLSNPTVTSHLLSLLETLTLIVSFSGSATQAQSNPFVNSWLGGGIASKWY